MEEELNIKDELIKKQENLIQEWKKGLKDQLDKHKTELNKVQRMLNASAPSAL